MTDLVANVTAWYLCADGKFIQPLDLFYLILPNYGRSARGEHTCVAQRPISIPLLEASLPRRTEWFAPDQFVDAVAVLLALCLSVAVGIAAAKTLWDRVDPTFRAIRPEHKKWYVVANLFKATFLGCIALSSRCWRGSYLSFFHDQFPGLELQRLSMLYVSTDAVALFLVPKLPSSTVVHHVVTLVMCVAASPVNLRAEGWHGVLGVTKMGVLYGTFSSLAFLVNAYLALRVVYPGRNKQLAWLCRLSLLSYLLCCGLNWGVHVLWLMNYCTVSVINVVYCFLILLIAYDDVVLMRWLVRRSAPPVLEKKLN